jgi:hypothetical protein
MKKIIIAMLIMAGLVVGIKSKGFASDWDKAGKILTAIEGVRIITGGKVDVIGSMTGINNRQESRHDYRDGYVSRDDHPRFYAHEKHYYRYPSRSRHVSHYRKVWVPHMVWVEKYVPEHREYKPGIGQIVVQAHYERYQVEDGGHWEIVYDRY